MINHRMIHLLLPQWELQFRADPYNAIEPDIFGQANGIGDRNTLSAFVDACLSRRHQISQEFFPDDAPQDWTPTIFDERTGEEIPNTDDEPTDDIRQPADAHSTSRQPKPDPDHYGYTCDLDDYDQGGEA